MIRETCGLSLPLCFQSFSVPNFLSCFITFPTLSYSSDIVCRIGWEIRLGLLSLIKFIVMLKLSYKMGLRSYRHGPLPKFRSNEQKWDKMTKNLKLKIIPFMVIFCFCVTFLYNFSCKIHPWLLRKGIVVFSIFNNLDSKKVFVSFE